MPEPVPTADEVRAYDFELEGALRACRDEFREKFLTYGHSWAVLRVGSLIDRMWTKAARLRRLEELESQSVSPRVPEGAESEYRGLVNYAIMLLDRLQHEGLAIPPLESARTSRWSIEQRAMSAYDAITAGTLDLLERKNHDYDGAWRMLRISTITDEILVRISRINSVLSGPTPEIDVIRDQLQDLINYALFALVKLSVQD